MLFQIEICFELMDSFLFTLESSFVPVRLENSFRKLKRAKKTNLENSAEKYFN